MVVHGRSQHLRRRLPGFFPAELTHQEFAQQPLSHWLDTVGMTKNEWKSIQHMETAILWNKGETFVFQALPQGFSAALFAPCSQKGHPRRDSTYLSLAERFPRPKPSNKVDAGGALHLGLPSRDTWEIQGSSSGLDLIASLQAVAF